MVNSIEVLRIQSSIFAGGSMKPNWERAVTEEQYLFRTHEITEATSRLFTTNRYEDITFAMIAKEANFTRSNLYRYFKTKEDIFLKLLELDASQWKADILQVLGHEKLSDREFASRWIDVLLKYNQMVNLLSILHTILEPKASIEALLSFGQSYVNEVKVVARRLHEILPFSSVETAFEFVFTQNSMVSSLIAMYYPSEKKKVLYEQMGMISDVAYFHELLRVNLENFLRGTLGSDYQREFRVKL